MSEKDNKNQGHLGQVAGLVSTLGRAVKERVAEFASEAREEVRTTLSEAKKELEEEIAAGKEPDIQEEVPQEEP